MWCPWSRMSPDVKNGTLGCPMCLKKASWSHILRFCIQRFSWIFRFVFRTLLVWWNRLSHVPCISPLRVIMGNNLAPPKALFRKSLILLDRMAGDFVIQRSSWISVSLLFHTFRVWYNWLSHVTCLRHLRFRLHLCSAYTYVPKHLGSVYTYIPHTLRFQQTCMFQKHLGFAVF